MASIIYEIDKEQFSSKAEELIEYFPEMLFTFAVSFSTLLKRNKKYTPDGSSGRFWNFEHQALIRGITTEEVFLNLIALKFARLQAGLNEAEDDSVGDSILDLANYALLFHAWWAQQPKT